jgi:Xaa-Pro aminopeptidase
MAVRDYRELQQGAFELVPFDFHFDMARAVKSEEELEGFRDSMDIILDGFHALLKAYEPGKSEAEIMAPAVERFFARCAGPRAMSDVYPQAMEAARLKMRDGVLACEVHKAAADVFAQAGFALGHLTGHSIGMTMLEYPAIGANSQIALKENMVLSFHPQVIDQEGQVCLYTQDTYRVGKKEGECLANVPWRFYSGAEELKTG